MSELMRRKPVSKDIAALVVSEVQMRCMKKIANVRKKGSLPGDTNLTGLMLFVDEMLESAAEEIYLEIKNMFDRRERE